MFRSGSGGPGQEDIQVRKLIAAVARLVIEDRDRECLELLEIGLRLTLDVAVALVSKRSFDPVSRDTLRKGLAGGSSEMAGSNALESDASATNASSVDEGRAGRRVSSRGSVSLSICPELAGLDRSSSISTASRVAGARSLSPDVCDMLIDMLSIQDLQS